MLKKIKAFLYRLLACVMMCFTLTFTIVGDYIGYQTIAVQATEVVVYEALKVLIELILGAMGLSMSSEVDLENCARGLWSAIKSYDDFMYGGHLVSQELMDKIVGWTMGQTITLSNECYEWLQNYLYNQVSGTMSSACDVSSPFISDVSAESVVCEFSTDSLIENGLFYGLYDVPLTTTRIWEWPSSFLYSPVIITELIPSDGYATLNIYNFTVGSDVQNGIAVFDLSEDGTKRYSCMKSSETSAYFSHRVAVGTYNYGTKKMTFDTTTSGAGTYQYMSSTLIREQYIVLDESEGNRYKIFINSKGSGVYSSVEEFNIQQFSSVYVPKSKVYGLSSTAKPYERNEEDNTVSIPYTSLGITKQVADAISSALAANPSITDAELNATASDVIAGIQGTTDAVNQNTKTLSTLLTAILSAVTGFKFVTAQEISQAFVTTFPWMRTIEDVFGDVYNGILDIPQAFVTTFPWMDTIGSVIGDIYDGILDIPQALVTVFPWADTLDDLIIGLPRDIANALSNGLSISIPDVATKDYSDILDGIAGTLASVFIVDTDAILAAVGALADVWADKLPINQFVSLYDGVSFSDDYSYPVIKIKRFDIFEGFYAEEYIILIDFAEYAEYMLWCRNLVRALFWFGFGLSLFKHLKADFHVG